MADDIAAMLVYAIVTSAAANRPQFAAWEALTEAEREEFRRTARLIAAHLNAPTAVTAERCGS